MALSAQARRTNDFDIFSPGTSSGIPLLSQPMPMGCGRGHSPLRWRDSFPAAACLPLWIVVHSRNCEPFLRAPAGKPTVPPLQFKGKSVIETYAYTVPHHRLELVPDLSLLEMRLITSFGDSRKTCVHPMLLQKSR